jgi:hypothetical protein
VGEIPALERIDMIQVRTEIMDNYFQACSVVDVDEVLFRKVSEPLDIPRPNAPVSQTIFCTSAAKIKMIQTEREKLAKEISAAVTNQLLEFMAKQDTVMGYKVVHK